MVSITVPQHPFNITINFQLFLLAVVISILIILPVLSLTSLQAWIIFALLVVLIYIALLTLSPISNLNAPFSVTPTPPHLGLDGISVNNYVSGMM